MRRIAVAVAAVAFGNPFSVAAGTQRTPLRPCTIRLTVDAQY
jgi:hypothetical protein